MLQHESRTASGTAFRALATRATWRSAFAGEMCGSRPDADAVTMSDGMLPFSAPSFFTALSTARAISVSASFRSVGPLLVPADAVASYPAPAAEGREWK